MLTKREREIVKAIIAFIDNKNSKKIKLQNDKKLYIGQNWFLIIHTS